MTTESESRMALLAVRENMAAWYTAPDLARALGAQCDLALQMLDEGDYEAARAAIRIIMAGHRAAGPHSMQAGL